MTTLADKIKQSANRTKADFPNSYYIPVKSEVIDQILRALRERDQAVEALREIDALDGEINPSNYDHDDACYLNRQFCYAGTIAKPHPRQHRRSGP